MMKLIIFIFFLYSTIVVAEEASFTNATYTEPIHSMVEDFLIVPLNEVPGKFTATIPDNELKQIDLSVLDSSYIKAGKTIQFINKRGEVGHYTFNKKIYILLTQKKLLVSLRNSPVPPSTFKPDGFAYFGNEYKFKSLKKPTDWIELDKNNNDYKNLVTKYKKLNSKIDRIYFSKQNASEFFHVYTENENELLLKISKNNYYSLVNGSEKFTFLNFIEGAEWMIHISGDFLCSQVKLKFRNEFRFHNLYCDKDPSEG